MKYIESFQTDPRWNLALEQYVFDSLDRAHSYFMLWQNNNTIVIGKNQNAVSEINNDFVREHGITVVRRLSGGGTVYHDMGNLNFTFVADSSSLDKINFHVFCKPIVETLAAFGVQATVSGRNDITIDGKKFSGNAQYIRDNRVMHHGTVMFDSDLTILGKALKVDREKIQSKGITSVSSRVTNIKEHLPPDVTLADFKTQLLMQISKTEPLTPYYLTAEDYVKIENIKRMRYDTWGWNFGQSPPCEINYQQRIENCGLVKISMDVKEGMIYSLQFSGDFFGNRDVAELGEKLHGCPCQKDAVRDVLLQCDLQQYIHNITPEQLAAIIVP